MVLSLLENLDYRCFDKPMRHLVAKLRSIPDSVPPMFARLAMFLCFAPSRRDRRAVRRRA
ncbi:MAG: hypothetical protein QM599_05300 [Pseudoxanthomonas sp.]